MKSAIIKTILFYRRMNIFYNLLASLGAPRMQCKYEPSCSHYAEASIKKYGVARGLLKSIKRVIRCNPFSKGGVDIP